MSDGIGRMLVEKGYDWCAIAISPLHCIFMWGSYPTIIITNGELVSKRMDFWVQNNGYEEIK